MTSPLVDWKPCFSHESLLCEITGPSESYTPYNGSRHSQSILVHGNPSKG
jgi:hypothetical protein